MEHARDVRFVENFDTKRNIWPQAPQTEEPASPLATQPLSTPPTHESIPTPQTQPTPTNPTIPCEGSHIIALSQPPLATTHCDTASQPPPPTIAKLNTRQKISYRRGPI